ncbi:hypothetical protein [Gordonia defluvii]
MTSRMIRYVRGLLGDESGMSTAEYSNVPFYTLADLAFYES